MIDTASFFVEARAAPLLARLKEFLAQRGVESWLVGGYVRDGLMGRANTDIDLVVADDAMRIAREVADAFQGSYVLLDERNGIARVVLPQAEQRWNLDFSTLRGSIEEDLAQRDFTINAIAIGLGEIGPRARLIDPWGGRRDLEQRLVRAVSDTAFQQDPARLVRAVRFAAELDFAIESHTQALIERHSGLVSSVAGERLRDELCWLFATPRTDRWLRWLDRLGLLAPIIPELTAARSVKQPKEHFWDVFEHSIETVAAVEAVLRISPWEGEKAELLRFVPWSPELAHHFDEEVSGGRTRKVLLKLAALLHDIGKPITRSVEPSGRIRFFGHSREGATMAGVVLERLRFSRRETNLVQRMIEHHLRPAQMSDDDLPSRRAIYRYFRDSADVAIDTLFLSLADYLATGGPLLSRQQFRSHAETIHHILSKGIEEQSIVVPPKLVDGHDLINMFGMRPGPEIGALLEAVREAQAAGELKNREEALDFAQRWLSREGA